MKKMGMAVKSLTSGQIFCWMDDQNLSIFRAFCIMELWVRENGSVEPKEWSLPASHRPHAIQSSLLCKQRSTIPLRAHIRRNYQVGLQRPLPQVMHQALDPQVLQASNIHPFANLEV